MTFRSFIFVLIFIVIFVRNSAFATTKGGCIPGTYLISESSGTKSLWTFTKDGTVQMASSAQGPLNFSDAQGAWKQTRNSVGQRETRVTILDFTYGSSTEPQFIARVDAIFVFSAKCTRLEGNFELRFFTPPENPLEPASDTGDPIPEVFAGDRVTAGKNNIESRHPHP